MIPVSLTLQGIYAYRQAVTIDFRPLVQARLFGIFGRTGSGKSTVVEAITYAIYGETERLNKRDGRAYNMMNLRSNELLIDYEFMALHPAVAFRCVVKGQRNRKRFDDAKSYEHSAYRRSGDEWVPVALGEIQAAVGLNYENFRRAVIIPQGRFQDFLQLSDTDRTRMMKELFELERFELAPKVAHLENLNSQRISHLTGKRSNFEKPDPAWFSNQQTLIDEHSQAVGAANSLLTGLNLKLARLGELASLHIELHAKREQRNALQADAVNINALENQLKRVVRCKSKFLSSIQILLADKQKMDELQPRLQQQAKLVEALKLKEKETLVILEAAEADHQKNEDRQARYDQLQHLRRQVEIFAEVTKTSESLSKGNEYLMLELQRVDPLRRQIEAAAGQLAEAAGHTASFPLLARLIQWFDEQQRLRRQVDEWMVEVQKAGERHAESSHRQNEIHATLHRHFPQADPELTGNALVEAAAELLRNEENMLRTEEQHLALQQKLQQLAGTLNQQEPCPVCGSLHHPSPLSPTDLTTAASTQKQKRKELEQARQVLETTRGDLIKTTVQANGEALRLSEITDRLNQARQALADHGDTFDGAPSYHATDEAAVRQAWTDATHWQAVHQQAEATLADLNGQQSKLEATLARYRERFDILTSQLTDSQNQLTKAQEQHLFSPDELRRSVVSVDEEVKLLKNSIDGAIRERERAVTERQKAHQNLFEAEARRQLLDSQIQEITQSIHNLTTRVEADAATEGFDGIAEVTALLTASFDEEQAARQIATHREQSALLDSRIGDLVVQLSGEPYSADDHESTKQLVAQASEKVTTLTVELDRLRQQLKQATDQQAEIEMLDKALDEAQLRAINLATLAKLFKASGFVNFVSSIYLEQLVAIANKRFHVLTNRQLSMELAEANNIVIRDYLNGGHVRSVKTLSGGQTFQASLSLALALADVVHARRPGTDNFFFLDEGFGSLDRESLQMVFDTLRTLRLENRIVGLISHVDELQQEIDAHIRVTNDDGEGSRIA